MNRLFQRKGNERGVALLAVLLLVVVLSTVALAVMDDIRFAIRRTANMRLGAQAEWYARGAEELAGRMVWRSWNANPSRSTLEDAWARQAVHFDIDGGTIDGRIADGGNCFNLNSVVERLSDGKLTERPLGVAQFVTLMGLFDIRPGDAEAAAAALVDWIDTDQAPSPQGAEDYDYALLEPPYRTAGTLLRETGELRAVRGFTEEGYRRLRPFICALPTEQLSPINVNTLRPEQAPLLVMLVGDDLSVAAARRLIEDRPSAGYAAVTDFWSAEAFRGLDPGADVRGQVRLNTRYFALTAHVTYHEAFFALNSLLELGDQGRVRVLSRRYGAAG